jgi:hypothetical protein
MSYCRFENTLRDLRDCYEYFDDEGLLEDEQKAREELISLCILIANENKNINIE